MENKTNINWFPGHMVKAINDIKENMKYIDLVCVILDSRIPYGSNNSYIFDIINKKPCIIVFNKADLADEKMLKENMENFSKEGYVTITTNANEGKGIKQLIEKIKEVGRKTKYEKKSGDKYKNITPIYRVLITGIPNVGKSTLINKLSGRKSANVGNRPGVTKSKQWIKINDNIELMDTPGLLWPKLDENDAGIKLAITGNIKEEILDIEELTIYLIKYLRNNKEYFSSLIDRYGLVVDVSKLSDYEVLEEIGKSRGAYLKGGEIDTRKISKILLDEFNAGKLGKISLE